MREKTPAARTPPVLMKAAGSKPSEVTGRRSARRRMPVFIGMAVACFLIVSHGLWGPLERKAYDFRIRALRSLGPGRTAATGRIAVVTIDDVTMLREKPQVFWYPDIGQFLTRMKQYGAAAVVIDIIPVHSLGEKIRNAAMAVTGKGSAADFGEFLDELGERADNALLGPLLDAASSVRIVQATAGEAVPYYAAEMSLMTNVVPANARLTKDPDGILRSQKLSFGDGDGLAYAAYKALGGAERAEGSVLINYLLEGNLLRHSFSDVITDKARPEDFSGKAVLLGTRNRFADMHLTPFGNQIPGVELIALIAETLLSGTGARKAGHGVEIPILLGMTGLSLWMAVSLRPLTALGGVLGLMTLFFLSNLFFFSRAYVVSLFPALFAPALLFGAIYPYRYVLEQQSRKKVYGLFSYYIDRKVIDAMIERDGDGLFRGERTDICILFLDIRKFTVLSERTEPERLIALLNEYFQGVTQVIQANEGFVNKFIGDGMLAFFREGADPVARAVRAALDITAAIEKMNVEGVVAAHVGDWKLAVGIGIHYGQVVMGNIGSEKKMDFTIIGNPVNVASRIEGLTRDLDEAILLSAEARRMVGEEFHCEHLGRFSLKGVGEEVDIYAVREGRVVQ